jgi:HK97 gp10 family phage protein
MAKGLSIQVEGMDKLLKKFKTIPKDVEEEVDAQLGVLGYGFKERAEDAVPIDTGYLKNKLSVRHVSVMNWEVVSEAPYSAYVEFGTITMVSVPAELTTYALQFKGKGILKTGGMPARPFFFVHLPWARTEVNKNLKEVVKRALAR